METLAGKLLSIDGIDGCGKSTQIQLLEAWFSEQDAPSIVVRDPGGTTLGEALRELLLHRKEIEIVPTAEMLIYMASRAQLVQEVIRPALAAGKTVLSDRFLLANVVYQGCGSGLATEDIWNVGQIATTGLTPDLTILLDLEPELAAARRSGRGEDGDRLESRGLEYMRRVRNGYLEQSRKLGEKILTIDASESAASVHDRIKEALTQNL